MSVNLRDRVYNDTGGIVQGATVQAILVTGGGTDAGTSSVVQATTTTDVNGVWKFSALPDPGAGNWYDVKITNGNQVRWRYGNIQAALNALLMSNTSYQVSALGIGTAPPGTTGQLQTTGNVGIGGAPSAIAHLLATGTLTADGTGFAHDLSLAGTLNANANTDSLRALSVTTAFGLNGHTNFTQYGGIISPTFVNSGGDTFGLRIIPCQSGNANNYGLYVNTVAGGSTINDTIRAFASGGPALRVLAAGNGDVMVGGAALGSQMANASVDGFLQIPTMGGAPSGVPTNANANRVPLVYDVTNNKLYAYNGAWKSVTLA